MQRGDDDLRPVLACRVVAVQAQVRLPPVSSPLNKFGARGTVARLVNVVLESAAAWADEIVYGACAWCPTRSHSSTARLLHPWKVGNRPRNDPVQRLLVRI